MSFCYKDSKGWPGLTARPACCTQKVGRSRCKGQCPPRMIKNTTKESRRQTMDFHLYLVTNSEFSSKIHSFLLLGPSYTHLYVLFSQIPILLDRNKRSQQATQKKGTQQCCRPGIWQQTHRQASLAPRGAHSASLSLNNVGWSHFLYSVLVCKKFSFRNLSPFHYGMLVRNDWKMKVTDRTSHLPAYGKTSLPWEQNWQTWEKDLLSDLELHYVCTQWASVYPRVGSRLLTTDVPGTGESASPMSCHILPALSFTGIQLTCHLLFTKGPWGRYNCSHFTDKELWLKEMTYLP